MEPNKRYIGWQARKKKGEERRKMQIIEKHRHVIAALLVATNCQRNNAATNCQRKMRWWLQVVDGENNDGLL